MAQNDQIQALIQEIDEVLSKTSPRLPWVMSTDAMRQRQVLEQARGCLDKLKIPNQGLTAQAIDSEARLLPSGQPAVESAQQVLQAVLQEMTYLRVNMLQPMRSDVELLRQQREALTQEIRLLEAQRQQYALPQQSNPQLLMEFLQSAMGQMQESLRGQVTQMVASLAVEGAESYEPPLLHGAENLAIASLSPVQRLEQIQRVQTQSDQLLLKLDSTLQVIFDSLQNNIQSYQESLEQGLSRMHSLGQQGEVMFSALVTRLAEQLGKEASVYLQSQVQPPAQPPAQPPIQPPVPPQISQGDRLALSAEAALDEGADTEIARLLDELNSLNPNNSNLPEPNSLDTRWQPQPFALEVGSLEALDQELQQLDLAALPDIGINSFSNDDDLTFFQEDQEFPFSTFASEDATRMQELDHAIPDFDRASVSFSQNGAVAPSDDRLEDLDSALDLLNQLSAEAEPSEAQFYAAESAQVTLHESLPVNPFNPDDILVESGSVTEEISAADKIIEAIAPPSPPSLIDSPDSLYDEFYQSMFGDAVDGNPSLPTLNSPSETPELSDLLSFDQETENELVQSLDLNEWFQEDALPALQANANRSENQVSEDQAQGFTKDQPEAAPHLTSGTSRLDEDLFGGAIDPADARPVRDAEADFLSDFSNASLPQSVETYLLSEPASPLELPALNSSAEALKEPIEEDLFWDLAEEMQTQPAAVSQSTATPIGTIKALTDLIPAYADSETPLSATEIPQIEIPEPDALWTTSTKFEWGASAESDVSEERPDPDAFEPAQPGEDLLILATPPETTIANFEIGEDTLQQLTADLSSLESPSASSNSERQIAPQSANLEDNLSADPLADLYLKTLPEEAIDSQSDTQSDGQASSQADQIASAITLEDLLFTDDLDLFIPDVVLSETSSNQASVQNVQAEQPPVQASADSQNASEEISAYSTNAFTLEGLDTLFEGVPSTAPCSEVAQSEVSKTKVPETKVSETEVPPLQAPDSESQPKKKI